MIPIARALVIHPGETFFLWGPRQTGKTSYLRERFPDAPRIDLLKSDQFRKYAIRPSLLREEQEDLTEKPALVIIDEIQKVPALLDEVHWLIEHRKIHFGLCGSSARKVRRGHANLLGGRAIRYELFGFVSEELGESFDLVQMLNHGYLPRMYLNSNPERLWRSYVDDYLKEEIANEGLVRKLPAFADFLRAAALADTEIMNFTNVGSDCGISKSAAQGYFEILVDTLLGRFLPAYIKRPKRRVLHAPKFYLADVGVVNYLAQRGKLLPATQLFGKALENWVHHELCAYSAYREKYFQLSYWRLSTGHEVDFIINDMEVAIEVKATARIGNHHLKGLREVVKDYPRMKRRILVSLEEKRRKTEDGIRILPACDFATELWRGEIV